MRDKKDIRWEQRFSNYRKALKKLTEVIDYIKVNEQTDKVLSEIIKEGLIQRFEYTYELAWNVMKDYAYYQGDTQISGSRDAIRFAFSANLIKNGDLWMDMIKSRIKTSHTYNEETAEEIYLTILNKYHSLFLDFEKVMEAKRTGKQKKLFD